MGKNSVHKFSCALSGLKIRLVKLGRDRSGAVRVALLVMALVIVPLLCFLLIFCSLVRVFGKKELL